MSRVKSYSLLRSGKDWNDVPEAVLALELVIGAKVILLFFGGHSYSEVRQKIACTDRYVSGWKRRFKLERLAGLDSRCVAPSTADQAHRPKRGF